MQTARDAARIEKLGKPAAPIVAKGFEGNARFNAKSEGLSDILLTVLPQATVPPIKEIEESNLGEQVAQGVITALTQGLPSSPEVNEVVEEALVFTGEDYAEARENMEKHFLQHCWSDGFPLVPATEDAVNRMLEAIEFPRNHVIGLIEPAGAQATVQKIATNAVMAGCLPQYMPVIIAAVEAITDPKFHLRGVQTTAGMVSPLLIVSGQKLIEQLNVNDSFSTIGPGWRANATIGRAIRLIMINLGNSWPGKNDMKTFGNPFKYITLMAENERAYMEAWEPIRVAEGFSYEQPTISLMPAVSWQVDQITPDVITADKIVELVARQGKVKYDRLADNWGMDNLVLLSPTAFDAIRRERRSRADIQRMLYEAIQVPGVDFFERREPLADVGPTPVPQWIIEKYQVDPHALVPLLLRPESIKIVVAGAPGPAMCAYIGTWGYGRAYFVTKPIRLPGNWERLLQKYNGWKSPIIR